MLCIDQVVLALSYLKDKKLRPSRKTFICRKKESKDKCNGLIGLRGRVVVECDGQMKTWYHVY